MRDLTAPCRQRAIRTCGMAAAVAISVFAASVPLAAGHAAASTAITITSGACGGGGTDFCFNPESASALTGSPVTWTNQSGVSHTATLCTPAACPGAPASTGSDKFNVSIAAAAGSTGSFTFTSPGTYYYYCLIHGYAAMHGRITVTAKQSSPTPMPTPSRRHAPPAPATGGAPGLLGIVAVVCGIGLLMVAAAVRRY